MSIGTFSSQHIASIGAQYPPVRKNRMISVHCQNQIVPLPLTSNVDLRIIKDMISSQRLNQPDFIGAADGSDLRSQRFGDLHRKGPYATGCPTNQDVLSRLNLPLIP